MTSIKKWSLLAYIIVAIAASACAENTQLSTDKVPVTPTVSQSLGKRVAPVKQIPPDAKPPEDLKAEVAESETAVPEEIHTTVAPMITDKEQLHLDALVVARGIENRKPLEPGTTFKIDPPKRIYAFMRVANPEALENEVTVSWLNEETGRERGTIAVSVGAQKRWRTWAYTRAVRIPGKWKVVVRNSEGKIIAEAPFEMTKEV